VLACSRAGHATFVASWRTWHARECWRARSARQSRSRTRAPCRPRQRSSAVAHPAVGRTVHDGDAPLEDSVRDGAPATAGAPSTGGVQSSCCVAMSRRADRAPRPAAARRPEGPGSTRGQTVDNREPDRAFALYRALFGIDELTQEKGTIREPGLVHPQKYAKKSLNLSEKHFRRPTRSGSLARTQAGAH
jgi:hypothetical protein